MEEISKSHRALTVLSLADNHIVCIESLGRLTVRAMFICRVGGFILGLGSLAVYFPDGHELRYLHAYFVTMIESAIRTCNRGNRHVL